MATSKAVAEDKKQDFTVPETVTKALEAIAKTIGVAVGELWYIFVRQYFVRGITEAFTGIVLSVASYFLFPVIGLWILIPLAVALMFFYGAILLLGNPKYYALTDITSKIQEFSGKKEQTSVSRNRFYF